MGEQWLNGTVLDSRLDGLQVWASLLPWAWQNFPSYLPYVFIGCNLNHSEFLFDSSFGNNV